MSDVSRASRPVSNPLLSLREHGQSVWLDFMRRGLVTSGELARLIAEDGVAGVTSNPTIFEKAIDSGEDYAAPIAALREQALSTKKIYERLALDDIRAAADLLRPVYERSGGSDGFANLEVSPELAGDTAGTITEARALWTALERPNVMVKVPGTPAGVPAVRALVAEGINVNITLLFSRETYRQVALAYLDGLEARVAAGLPVDRLASVASFFVSRIDTAVDALLEKKAKEAPPAEKSKIEGLIGKTAIANARLAYEIYEDVFSASRFARLARRGARVQRVLWASTSTKSPRYRDVRYVEELIGPDTVNTMTPETLAAFRDHGRVRDTLQTDLPGARETLNALEAVGISLASVTEDLVDEGVRKFAQSLERLLRAIERR